jgi:hypothetical protein
VTYRVRPLTPMAVHHKTFDLPDFFNALPDLKALGYSMMFYIFPFANKVTVEFRKYNPGATGSPDRHVWALRNHLWATVGPKFANDTQNNVSNPSVRYAIIDNFLALSRFNLETLVKSDNTVPGDQIIRYPAISNDSRYTFSLFAFPEEQYRAVLSDYFKFSTDYYQQKGYRSNLLSVGYRIAKDQQSLLSYSFDGTVITVDPVSTGNPGWQTFQDANNDFCTDRGGLPLLNQTAGLTSAMVRKAFGDRWKTFEDIRRAYDPQDRLLNQYFRKLVSED